MASLAVLLLWGLLVAGAARAENTDPGSDGSQYVYAENAGWINLQPQGPGGPGMHVGDFDLTGWLWAENLGWISLSCRNTSSCDTVDYGVVHDGSGVLEGYAWSEGAGWINFGPASGGVTIDVSTGIFDGHAWSESLGWISFRSTGSNPFSIATSWTCDPAPATPTGIPALTVSRSGTTALLSWSAVAGATGYDVASGDLELLRGSGGDFSVATTSCEDDNETGTGSSSADLPAVGNAVWYVVRPANCGGSGSYDSAGAGQVAGRDAGIAASGSGCP